MPYIDQAVLLLIVLATSALAVHLRRSGAQGRRFLIGVWLAFYGVVLTTMMAAHSVDILYATYRGGLSMDGTAWAYTFRTYSLHLLGGVLIWQGARCLHAVLTIGRGGPVFDQDAFRATLVTLLVVLPLIPIHAFFGVLLTTLSAVSLLALAAGRTRPAVVAEPAAPVAPA